MTAFASLEFGRAVLLTQALDARSDLSDLQVCNPELAKQYIELRDELDTEQSRPVHRASALGAHVGLVNASELALEQLRDRNAVAAEFDATVAKIRHIDGFENFRQPSGSGEFMRQAGHGPIVAFNVSRSRSDAFIVQPDGITNLNLPNLAPGELTGKVHVFYGALENSTSSAATIAEKGAAQKAISNVLEWLWETVTGPVLEELGFRRTPEPGAAWPRVWWAPGGLLSLLPIHAAGYHRNRSSSDTVVDRVISTYTPTVRALSYARQRDVAAGADHNALIVAMPTSPGLSSLAMVSDEVTALTSRFPEATLLAGREATNRSVLKHLPSYSLLHFACHSEVDMADPSQSRLLLHDHETRPLTIRSLTPVKLERVRLAYLSACRTMFNAPSDLIDESIHMASAFQLLGCSHVVATLWEIEDATAARVADDFYAGLIDGGVVDPRRAPYALHHAWRAVRDEYREAPSLWAGFVHAGA